jgi:molecular chaperone HtpG
LAEDRKKFEDGWDDIRSFINYGFISDSEKFYDRAKEFAMFKDTEGKYFTFDEYKTLIEANQKDKNDNLVYLYATDVDSQTTYIETAKDKGYSVLLFNEQSLDILALQTLEQKFDKSSFKRVDSDVISRLIDKGEETGVKFDEKQEEVLRESFQSRLEGQNGKYFNVMFADLGEDGLPVVVSQSEWGRRMKDNSKFQSQSWYMGMGDNYTLTLNTASPLVNHLASDLLSETEEKLKPVQEDIDEKDKAVKEINEKLKDVKWEDQTEEQKKERQDAETAVQEARQKKHAIYKDNAADNKIISQIIDVAMLSAGLLKGDALNKFLKRTVEFIK